MNNKIFILSLAFIFSNINVVAQQQVTLPQYIPPSPDVSAMTRGAELSANPNTGTANASIPIYELKLRNFSMPISLNYSANGFKPGELPSRVGVGWTLNAGGVVSRIVHGKVDDDFTIIENPLDPSQFYSYDQVSYDYLNRILSPTSVYDSQPDEYRFSVNGISGKFFIKRDGSILVMPASNLKVSVTRNGSGLYGINTITILDDRGISYLFGAKKESTFEHNQFDGNIHKQMFPTAWFLDKITLPTGEYMDFVYSSEFITHFNLGKTTTTKVGLSNAQYCTNNCGPFTSNPNAPPTYCPTNLTTQTTETIVKYSTYSLETILASNGTSISFQYGPRLLENGSLDNTGEKRLIGIRVMQNGALHNIKQYALDYANGYHFFLKKVILQDPTTTSTTNNQAFEIEYVDENEPTPGGEDYVGFANGGGQGSVDYYPEYFGPGALSDKNPNGNFSQKRMLKKIKYPTGGWDEFAYEPNMESYWGNIPQNNITSLHVEGTGSPSISTYFQTVTIPVNQTGRLYVSTSWIGSGAPCCPDPNKVVVCTLTDNTSGAGVKTITVFGYAGKNEEVVLIGGHTYTLTINVWSNYSNFARADLVYAEPQGTLWGIINNELCGVRVKQITSFDPVSNKSFSKYYRYWSLTDTTNPSAVKLYQHDYISDYYNEMLCTQCGVGIRVLCQAKVLSTNNVIPLYISDGTPVAYKWVIEHDDPNYANGLVEHTYEAHSSTLLGHSVLNLSIPNKLSDPYTYKNGRELDTRFYNSQRQQVKWVHNQFVQDIRRSNNQYLNYIVRQRYEHFPSYPLDEFDFEHIDVEQYPILSMWDHIEYTETKEFDVTNNIVLTNRITYIFGNDQNLSPTEIHTKGSDGKVHKKLMKYPNDLASSNPIYQELTDQNRISEVVEEEVYKETKFLNKTSTVYDKYYLTTNTYSNKQRYIASGSGAPTHIFPAYVKIKKGNSPDEIRLRYHYYDEFKNSTVLFKENGAKVSYIWDYDGKYPVAEIVNGALGNFIAYSSFEADGKGEWEFDLVGIVSDPTSPTGLKSFDLTGRTVIYRSDEVNEEEKIVMYWKKEGQVTIGLVPGTPLITRNGWTLYKHTLPAGGLYSRQITISGDALIDELRLFTKGAFMKSITYKPGFGITHSADINSNVTKFEYDGFNRLIRSRDPDGNIIRQIEYAFNQMIEQCPNASPNWVATGVIICKKNNIQNNNNNGIQQSEERDLNNCSPSYMQLRYVDIGTNNSACPVVQNCSGPDKRVVNGACQTGTKVNLASKYLGDLTWECGYYYLWSDGYRSINYISTSSNPCSNVIVVEY